MSRNVKDCNRVLFEKIYAISEEFDDQNEEKFARWLYGDSSDFDLVANARIDWTSQWERQYPSAMIVHKGRMYFLCAGFGAAHDSLPTFISIDLTPGMFLLTYSSLRVPALRSQTGLAVQNEILARCKSDSDYSGHDLSTVSRYFPALSAYEILPDSPVYNFNYARTLGRYLTLSSEVLPLEFPVRTINRIDRQLGRDDPLTPYTLIVDLLIASSYESSFLQAYRMVELLYQLSDAAPLFDKVNPSISFSDFLRELTTSLDWRPNERQTLESLVSRATDGNVTTDELLRSTFWHDSAANPARKLYLLRNSIVHRQLFHDDFELGPDDWFAAIDYLLDLVEYFYPHYATLFGSSLDV